MGRLVRRWCGLAFLAVSLARLPGTVEEARGDTIVHQFTFPSRGIAPGTYQFFVGLIRSGSLQDDRIDPGDILALDVQPLVFSP